MPRRSRMRKASRMSKARVDGLDHPKFASSYYKRARGFANLGEAQLNAQEKMLKRI